MFLIGESEGRGRGTGLWGEHGHEHLQQRELVQASCNGHHSTMVYRIYDIKSETASGRNTPPERPAQAYHVSEPPYEGYHAVEQSAYRNSAPDSAIVIDNGMLCSSGLYQPISC